MKKYSIFIIISLTFILSACSSQETMQSTGNHTDTFVRLEAKQDVDVVEHTDTDDSIEEDTVDNSAFELKEYNTVPDYSEEELQQIEDDYNNNAEPNIIIDDSSEDEVELTTKTVTINGEELTIYVNE